MLYRGGASQSPGITPLYMGLTGNTCYHLSVPSVSDPFAVLGKACGSYSGSSESRFVGTCQIKIQVSGQYAEEHPVQVQASPDDLREVAALTTQRCLIEQEEGGYSTYEFARVVNWITAPEVRVHGPSFPHGPAILERDMYGRARPTRCT